MTAVVRLCLAALRHHECLARQRDAADDDFLRADSELIARSLSPKQRRNLTAKGPR